MCHPSWRSPLNKTSNINLVDNKNISCHFSKSIDLCEISKINRSLRYLVLVSSHNIKLLDPYHEKIQSQNPLYSTYIHDVISWTFNETSILSTSVLIIFTPLENYILWLQLTAHKYVLFLDYKYWTSFV